MPKYHKILKGASVWVNLDSKAGVISCIRTRVPIKIKINKMGSTIQIWKGIKRVPSVYIPKSVSY